MVVNPCTSLKHNRVEKRSRSISRPCGERHGVKPAENQFSIVDEGVPVWAKEIDSVLGELLVLVEEMSMQQRSLKSELESLKEKHCALCDSIYTAGVLVPLEVSHQERRRRTVALSSACLQSPSILLVMVRSLGRPEALRLSQTAAFVHKAASGNQAFTAPQELVRGDIVTSSHTVPVSRELVRSDIAGSGEDVVIRKNSALALVRRLFRFPPENEPRQPKVTDFIALSDIAACMGWIIGIATVRRLRVTAKAFAEGFRETFTEMRAGRTATIYVCGGSIGSLMSTVDRLDPATGRWEAIPPMCTARHACSAVSTRGCLYVFGGGGDGAEWPERFDPDSNTWEPLPQMGTPLSHGSAAVADRYIYIFGGLCMGKVLSVVQRFDSIHGDWEYMTPLTLPRFDSAALSLDGFLYIIGGACRSGDPLALCERLRPDQQEWESLPGMSYARHGCAAATTSRMLYVFGGGSSLLLLCVAEFFDVDSYTWGPVPSMPVPRKCFGAVATAGRVYVFGGVTNASDSASTVDYMDPSSYDWVSSAPVPTIRTHCCAVAVLP